MTVPSGGGAPVVEFKLTNQLTQGLKGLLPADVRFTIAQLKPGVGGGSSAWQSYVTRLDGTTVQATAETATADRLVDHGDGTYTYTFAQALTAYTGATYDGTLTHRVGLEVRNNAPTTNGPLDFVPAGGTVTTERLIVDNDNCQACHDVLEFHGGARFDTQYCVTCHNPSTHDGQAPNYSVDMKVLIHKIHGAEFLSEKLQPPYTITGNGGKVYDFSHVVFPQDVRNCTTCHDESDPDTPQASNWQNVANREACGTCHADINFAAGGHPGNLTFSDDTQCLDCHGPNATVNGGAVRIATAHQVPIDVQSAKFQYEVVSVTASDGGTPRTGDVPRITIKVFDPTNGNAPYDIQALPGGPFDGASLRVDLAWNGTEFHNAGSAGNTPSGAPFQPTQVTFATGSTPVAGVTKNADLTFSANAPVALPDRAVALPGADPTFLTGGLTAILEGRPKVDGEDADAEDDLLDENGKVDAVGKTFGWDSSAAERPSIVDINRCNECHQVLSLHGGSRTGNTQLCTTCHNPNATDIRQHGDKAGVTDDCFDVVGDATKDVAIDFPVLIHSIHAAARRASQGAPAFKVCGNGNSVHDYSHVGYPGAINNCENCHVKPTSDNPSYYGRDPAKRLAITRHAGDRLVMTDDIADSPTAGTCVACHSTSTATNHMTQNGGVFGGVKQATGHLLEEAETCLLCHGPGKTADIREMHKIDFYPLNQ
ncbi:MAG TPA: OmcA/MtrC family decaheme c-type cytochrome [Povalibacter sp.]